MSDKTEVSDNMGVITSKAGELTVLKSWIKVKYCPVTFCTFRCFCGNIFEAKLANVKSGNTKSCGCHRSGRLYKHGHSMNTSKTYTTWAGTKAFCTNKNNPKYHEFAERGIKLCEEWLDFENFLSDMGEKPPGFRLNRLNKDRGFEPGNCEWTPIKKKSVGK